LFNILIISEFYILVTIVLLSLGAMAYLTSWLIRCRSASAFLALVWVGYVIIIVTGGATVLHALQQERHHWTRFFTSTCQLFGALVQAEAHDQIEFSYSLWSEPYHPDGLPLDAELPQPDLQFSTRPLDIPQQIRWVDAGSLLEGTGMVLDWQEVPDASEYEVAWLEHPDSEEGWVTVYQGPETSVALAEPGWFRVRSLRITPLDDPVYLRISQILVDSAMSIPGIASVYTMRDYSDQEYVFIVCPEMDANRDGVICPETERLAPIGETYPREGFAEIPPGVRTPVITDFSTVDEWGTWYSVSVALYRPDGSREGYVGVDYPVAALERNILQTQITYTIFLVVVLAMYFFGVVQVPKLHRASEEQRVTANDLRRTVAELTEAKKMAESAARAKSYFLTNMSHEIRTPMNAVLGFASILGQRLMACCPPDQREDNLQTIHLIEKSSSDLLTIIGDILDFSKVDEGRVEIKWVPTMPQQIIEDVSNVVRPRMLDKPHLTFDCEIDPTVPQWFYSDPTRLRQILGNICGNAVKFSDKGTIRLSCRQLVVENTPESIRHIKDLYGQSLDLEIFIGEKQMTLLQFAVEDQGIGISAHDLEKLFQPFTQADASLTRRFGGTGLGLSIALHLTKLMGGDIAVRSKENEGSTFMITFVVSEKHRQLGAASGFSGIVLLNDYEKPLEGRNILVVEDGKVNQIVITKMLRDAGAMVKTAENGVEAIKKIEESHEEFDVVLMDMQMPVMDGYEATLRLRCNGFKKPIIAVTAHALTGDLEKTLQVGCDAYISKPVDKNKLIDEILKFDLSALLLQ
jgi:signal transduction histidine kinase/ActR/RegA family two-component response regulator